MCLGLLGEIRRRGGWIGLEHPADRQRHPFPSFFATDEVKRWCNMFRMVYYVTDQCMFGSVSRKPTGLLLPVKSGRIRRTCNHKQQHAALTGRDEHGGFKTTPAAHYPREFGVELAHLMLNQYHHSLQHGYERPYRPHGWVRGDNFLDPWVRQRYVSYAWIEPSPDFLTLELEAQQPKNIWGPFVPSTIALSSKAWYGMKWVKMLKMHT